MPKKNIKIICYIVNSFSNIPFEVNIYNKNKELISKGKTDKYGIFNFCSFSCEIYQIIVKSSHKNIFPYQKTQIIYIHSCTKILPFIFFTSIPKPHRLITLKLIDKNYKNLPIEKGEIKIWNI